MPKSDQASRGSKKTSATGPRQSVRRGKGFGRATPKASKSGRATDPGVTSGRYTPPIPKDRRKSPAWHGVVLLVLLVGGLALIVLNYVGVLPGGIHNYYLIAGILAMIVGLIMATFYR